jgi:hypothetical protein
LHHARVAARGTFLKQRPACGPRDGCLNVAVMPIFILRHRQEAGLLARVACGGAAFGSPLHTIAGFRFLMAAEARISYVEPAPAFLDTVSDRFASSRRPVKGSDAAAAVRSCERQPLSADARGSTLSGIPPLVRTLQPLLSTEYWAYPVPIRLLPRCMTSLYEMTIKDSRHRTHRDALRASSVFLSVTGHPDGVSRLNEKKPPRRVAKICSVDRQKRFTTANYYSKKQQM